MGGEWGERDTVRGYFLSQWERPENKCLNKIAGLIRQTKRNTDSKSFVFRCWEPRIHAALDGAQMHFSQGVRHRSCPWREVPPFCSFKLLQTFFLKKRNSVQKECSHENFSVQVHAQVELPAGSFSMVRWLSLSCSQGVWTCSTTRPEGHAGSAARCSTPYACTYSS